MKIVHVTFNLRVGGAETMMIDIMNRQIAEGAEVALVLINEGHDEFLFSSIDPAVKIVRLKRPTGSKNPLWLWRYNRALAQLRPDVVHAHNVRALGMLYGPRSYRVAFTYHCVGDVNPYAKRIDRPFAISQAVKDDVEARGECSPSVIFNGINTAAIPRRDRRQASTPLRLVQIGSLKHLKGQDLSLRALSAIPEASLDLYGQGPWEKDLRQLAAELGVADRVRFLGAVSREELYAALPHYDIALLPSRSEGFGLALAEPMAAGVPVVSVALPGPLEVLDGGRLGETFAPDDCDALVEAVRRVAADYPRALARADEAADYVRANFDISATTRHYLNAY